ncbi:hypothetical protein ABZT26_25815 [Streptomyces sp. NPDC005395]|uniref:hypothetical protein n=1 Tax=Streptomyces sp. NPDC005395 TaxID=3157042 RepID=UPI0033B35A7F
MSANHYTPDDIAAASWTILSGTVSAPEATAECENCGYGLVALPKPIRLKVTAEGIGGGYLRTEFMDYAHWADDEQRQEDAAGRGFHPCGEPSPRGCTALDGTGCDGLVYPGEDYCAECLKVQFGAE